ncbi:MULTISPECIES: ABC transporter ATP-binding protein [Cytobacillus]|uniref:Phosphate ABC transporter ATP-binding protein n=1 Tax=Cytobacillus stercorigallinarum TaxID=2762240 RepID=A0ABR8QLU7_9BACI|nr:phosphate ABC transporter ATP-binding protein [Cytobacillus stercorigallinarum]MBD7936503.1 phosphate ABC transporter ATP-binding protein [Cytobacillus stercorigallinarum]
MQAAISFQNVHYHTDSVAIIKDITGAISSGNITTVVGPSGSGKSTLFHLCNGMKSASSGDIFIQGEDILTLTPTVLRRKVGIVLQKSIMIEGNVFDNLSLPLSLHGKRLSKEKAIEMLHLIGLNETFLHRKATDLSGGQQQRVSIARTLLNEPAILLLDEVTSALDQSSQREIEQLITSINQKKETTIIWITHNLEQALRIGDDTWVMIDGKLAAYGKSAEVASSTNDKVKQFFEGGEKK